MSMIRNAIIEAFGNTLPKIKPCPFCGGNASLSYRDIGFGGWNCLGDKKLKYRVQVICDRCKSRGKPITTDFIINANPYYANGQKAFEKYNMLAIDKWNTRKEGEQDG